MDSHIHIRTAASDPSDNYEPAGGTVEEYPDARIIHRGDDTVSIVGKTERGDTALAQAAASLGIHTNQTVYALVVEEEENG